MEIEWYKEEYIIIVQGHFSSLNIDLFGVSIKDFLKKKYTNPANGILDFCWSKSYGPSNCVAGLP